MRFTKEIRHGEAMTVCCRYGVGEAVMTHLAQILMREAPEKFPKARMIVLDIEANFTTFEEVEGDLPKGKYPVPGET